MWFVLANSYHISHKLNRVFPLFHLTSWLALSLSIRALHLVHFHNFLFRLLFIFSFYTHTFLSSLCTRKIRRRKTWFVNFFAQQCLPFFLPAFFFLCSPCVLYLKPNNVNIFAWHFANEFSIVFSPPRIFFIILFICMT